jgi:hypothetical protein
MTSKRIAQTNQSEKPQVSGILQRAAVRSVSDAGMQSTDDREGLALSNSAFSKDFSRVPISTTKPQPIMAKLMIGAVGDKYEQEADRVAAQVVQRINVTASVQSGENESVQREEMETKNNEARLMRSPILQRRSNDGGMPATPDLETSINQARGSGQPLVDNIREPMEQAFGADFSGVRVHTDAQADQFNQSIQAKAFTTKQDVFFRQGAYQPESRVGQALIAHELTHVVQQNGKGLSIQRKNITLEARCEKNRDAANKVPVVDEEKYLAGFTMPVKVKESGGKKAVTPINERYFIRQYAGDNYKSIEKKGGKFKKNERKMTDDGYGQENNMKGDQIATTTEISWEDTPGWTSAEASLISPQHIKDYVFNVRWLVKETSKGAEYLSSQKQLKMNTEEVNEQGDMVITYVEFQNFQETTNIEDEVEPPETRRSTRLKGKDANQ